MEQHSDAVAQVEHSRKQEELMAADAGKETGTAWEKPEDGMDTARIAVVDDEHRGQRD